MQKKWDAILIGTGPAGLAFASTASGLGLNVLALDEQAHPGGQIYRDIERQPHSSFKVLGPDYQHGVSLVEKFRKSDVCYRPQSLVWKVEANGSVCYSHKGSSHEVMANKVVVAIGAMERPAPFPGWTLPGVIGVGAIDTLYKSSGIVPEGPVVMVGNGPLMLSVANHLNQLGVSVSHFLDTRPYGSIIKSLRHLLGALSRSDYLLKGAGMIRKSGKGVRIRKKYVTRYAAHGNEALEAVTYQNGKTTNKVKIQSLLVHEGIIPRTEFSRQLHLDHLWDHTQRYWYPKTNSCGRTSEPNIYIIGDNAFVHGALAAEYKGVLAALDVAGRLNSLAVDKKKVRVGSVSKLLNKELKPRPFVDSVYRPRRNLYTLDDETILCRCEEISVEKVKLAILQGMKTPEMVKGLTRCGMGPCQGRMCSSALAETVAAETQKSVEHLSPANIRPPVRNLFAGELAKMELINHSTRN